MRYHTEVMLDWGLITVMFCCNTSMCSMTDKFVEYYYRIRQNISQRCKSS